MTPIGHFSVAYISGKSLYRASLPAVIIGGLLPDIDFTFVLFDFFNQVHRVITHNILFILLAVVCGVLLASRGRKVPVGLGLLLGGALHLFIDSCMDNNPTNGVGIALFWPLTDDFFSPFNLLSFTAGSHGWNDPLRMLRTLIPNMLFEVPFYLIAAALLLKRRIFNSKGIENA